MIKRFTFKYQLQQIILFTQQAVNDCTQQHRRSLCLEATFCNKSFDTTTFVGYVSGFCDNQKQNKIQFMAEIEAKRA